MKIRIFSCLAFTSCVFLSNEFSTGGGVPSETNDYGLAVEIDKGNLSSFDNNGGSYGAIVGPYKFLEEFPWSNGTRRDRWRKRKSKLKSKLKANESQPICLPVEHLPEGKYKPGTNLDHEITMPPWFNRKLGNRGREFAKEHFFQIFYALALSMILQSSSLIGLRRIFAFTGNTLTPEKAGKRFTANTLQMKVWYYSEGYDESPEFQQSVAMVRSIHETVAFKAEHNENFSISAPAVVKPPDYVESPMWIAFRQDIEESGILKKYPVFGNRSKFEVENDDVVKFNQFDMSGGLWTFFCPPLMMPEALDIHNATKSDLLGFAHFWAGIGYILGIEDQFNVANQRDLVQGVNYCRKFYEEIILPHMFHIDYEGQIAVERAIDGIMGVVPKLMSKEGYFLKMLEDMVGIQAPNLRKIIGPQDQVARPFEYLIIKPMLTTSWGQKWMNYNMRSWLKDASLKYFGIDGKNLSEIAEKAYFY